VDEHAAGTERGETLPRAGDRLPVAIQSQESTAFTGLLQYGFCMTPTPHRTIYVGTAFPDVHQPDRFVQQDRLMHFSDQ
jgi:hypothetical protein